MITAMSKRCCGPTASWPSKSATASLDSLSGEPGILIPFLPCVQPAGRGTRQPPRARRDRRRLSRRDTSVYDSMTPFMERIRSTLQTITCRSASRVHMTSQSEDQIRSRGPITAFGSPLKRPVDGWGLPPDWLLVPRPHLQLHGNALHSVGLPDRFRQLSKDEVELWNLMQRSVSVQEALQSCSPGADRLIRTFLCDGLCELVEPAFPANRRRVLIVEPHADDAVLSVGGTMWLRRHECNFVIATVASRSNHTRYRDLGSHHDINTVTEIRRREADLAARMLGGEHVSVGMSDASLRYHDAEWTAEFYRRHRMSIRASILRTADPAELRRWVDALQCLI